MILKNGSFSDQMWWPLAGIFLLAAGASAFNQYQEWRYDEKMERTRKRPIPSRRISPAEGTRIAMIGIAGGFVILMYQTNIVCLSLGIFNLLWYNGIYTWLKKKTAFAVVPGALTGAIPVLMGWTALNGNPADPEVMMLAFFIFIWQMPHFWMMMLKYGHQYRAAGFPTLLDHFPEKTIKIIVTIWIVASSMVSLFFIYFRMIFLHSLAVGIILVNAGLIIILLYQFFMAKQRNDKLIFMSANIYLFLILLLLIAEKFHSVS